MLTKLKTFSLVGIEALPIEVEIDVSPLALPKRVQLGKTTRESIATKVRNNVNPLKWVALYEKGVLTKFDICIGVFPTLTNDNIQEFLEKCPENVRSVLRDFAAERPADDDDKGWARFKWETAGYPDHRISDYERAKSYEEARRLLRRGVRLFRTDCDSKGD